MADERLRYLIEAIWKGSPEAKKAAQEIKGVGEAGKSTTQHLKDAAASIGKASLIFGSVAIAARKTYQAIGEGAQLELARSQFDNLAESVGSTGDAMLTKLRQATRGLATDAELIEAASGIISTGLANTEDGVVRLANVSTRLGLDMQQVILTFANNSKARLDSLGLSIQDVTKRQQEFVAAGMDMDSAFDLAVLEALEDRVLLLGDAVETTAGKLQKIEVRAKNTSDAFKLSLLNAVEPVIDRHITLIDAADSLDQAFAQGLITQSQYREMQIQLARGGTAAARGVMEQTSALLQEADAAREAASATEEVTQALEKMPSRFDVDVRFLDPKIFQGHVDSIMANTNWIATVDVQVDEEEVDEEAQKISSAISSAVDSAISQQGSIIDRLFGAQEGLAAAGGQWVQGVVNRSAEIAEIQAQLNADLTKEEREFWQERVEAAEEGSAEWLQAVTARNNDLTDAQREQLIVQRALLEDEHGQLTSYFTGNLEEQKKYQEQVAQLQQELRDSYAQIGLDALMESGGFNEAAAEFAVAMGLMSEAQAEFRLRSQATSEALGDVTKAMAEQRITPEQGAQIFSGLITASQDANVDIQAAINEAQTAVERFASGDWIQVGNGWKKMLDPGVTSGGEASVGKVEIKPTVDTSEIEAMITGPMAEIRAWREEVNTTTVAPPVDDLPVKRLHLATGEAQTGLDTLTSKDYKTPVDHNLDQVTMWAQRLKIAMDQVPSSKTITVTTVGGGPGGGPGFAQGGSFTVPPGFPNDTFPLRVSSGERVTVETPAQQAQEQQPIHITGPVTFSFPGIRSGNPREMASAVVGEFANMTRG